MKEMFVRKLIFITNNPIPKTQKNASAFFRVRDVEGAVGGTSWNERRNDFCVMSWIFLSEVQRSTEAKRTPKQARRRGLDTRVGKAGTPKLIC
jgi:hypothetical protein